MPGQRIGSTIAAVFGLIYVVVNSAELPAAVAWSLRGLAVIAFAAILFSVWKRSGVHPISERAGHRANPFGRRYWLVVAAEVVALFGGLRVLTGPLDHPEGGVAWVSFVVGVHFFALAKVFAAPFFNWLGTALTVCGVLGLMLTFSGASAASIAIVAGIIPGGILLGFAWWGATSRMEPAPGPPVH